MNRDANLRLHKVMPSLPPKCRTDLQQLASLGWECGFFLGVAGQTMILCLAAEKGERRHVVFDEDMIPLVAKLKQRIEMHSS